MSPRLRLVLRAVAPLLCVPVVATGIAAPAAASVLDDPGSIGVRLTEAPASLADDPRAQTYIIDDVDPGTSFTRTVEVSNTTESPQRVTIYPGPASLEGGSWLVEDAGGSNELTEWVDTSVRATRIPAGGSAPVDVTISVPADATGGERYGVVWAAVSSRGDGNVRLVNRVGIRVYLGVSGPEGLATDFAISSLTPSRAEDGTPVVTALFDNVGERALDLTGRVRLSDGPGGVMAGPFSLPPGVSLAPGQTVAVPVALDPELARGPWDVVVRARSGVTRRQASATLTFPSTPKAGGAEVPTVAAGPGSLPSTGASPMLAPALVGGSLVTGLALFVLWRRRRRDDLVADGGTAAVTDQEWLASLDRWAAGGGPAAGT